jgi:hypothetical protein
MIDTMGLSAFQKECQHRVKDRAEGVALRRHPDRRVFRAAAARRGQALAERARAIHETCEFYGIPVEEKGHPDLGRRRQPDGHPGDQPRVRKRVDRTRSRSAGEASLVNVSSRLRVVPVASENKLRITSVERSTTCWTAGRAPVPARCRYEWRLGMNAGHEGTPQLGSRLIWEIENWTYPIPRPGEEQKQDPDDSTADGADCVASMRYGDHVGIRRNRAAARGGQVAGRSRGAVRREEEEVRAATASGRAPWHDGRPEVASGAHAAPEGPMMFSWPIVLDPPRAYRGLGYFRFLRFGDRPLRAPFGWRWMRKEDRHAAVLLPLWLYWPVTLWRARYQLLFEPLIRFGLWRVREEGDRYVDGHATAPHWLKSIIWCFVHDADHAPDWRRLEFEEWYRRRDAQRYAAARWRERMALKRALEQLFGVGSLSDSAVSALIGESAQ